MLFLVLVLTACQNKDSESVEVFVYTNLPQDSIIKGENPFIDNIPEGTKVSVKLFPGMLERVMIDIVAHSGDILIVEKEMLSAILDPVGLHPLDDMVEDIDSALKAEDDNKVVRVYAVPVSTSLLDKIPDSAELVAVLPIYSKKSEEALSLLKSLVGKDGVVQ